MNQKICCQIAHFQVNFRGFFDLVLVANHATGHNRKLIFLTVRGLRIRLFSQYSLDIFHHDANSLLWLFN